MKRAIAMMLMVTVLSGCTSATEFGQCVGMFEDKKQDLTYNISGWNAFVAVLGTSLLFIPTILVIKDQTFCPTGRKQ